MTIGMKCTKCGLLQMPSANCKSCGAPLAGPGPRPIPSAAPASVAATPAAPSSLPFQPGFSQGEAIRFGWATTKSNLGFFVGLFLVMGLILIGPALVAELAKDDIPILYFFISIVLWFVNVLVQMGLLKITLRFCDGEKGRLADLFACLPSFLKFLLGSILYGLIVLAGTLLLVVPGIIWAIKYMFFSYLIVDQGLGPIDSLKKSAAMTKGYKWDLFLFWFLLGLINLAGVLCLFVGLLVTVPITMVATAYAYRRLLSLESA